MIALLLALAAAAEAPPQGPIDAERAFAADAKTIGQWAAFRKWSTDDAVMFVPQPTNAHDFLKDRKDPPVAIDWWPTASYMSCDGKLAVNTGGWKRPDGSVGYFSTVWQRQPDGTWKWVVDGGDTLKESRERPKTPLIRTARCADRSTSIDAAAGDSSTKTGRGASADASLLWWWSATPDGGHVFSAAMYDGKTMVTVIADKIAAQAK